MIIVEGPDGSGKSTLVSRLSSDLNIESYHMGGRPRDPFETMTRAVESIYRLSQPCIQDRSTLISECVYSWALQATPALDWLKARSILRALNPVVLYCRPPVKKLNPIAKAYDDPAYVTKLADVTARLVEGYDRCFRDLDCIRHDYDFTHRNAEIHYRKVLETCKLKIALGYGAGPC